MLLPQVVCAGHHRHGGVWCVLCHVHRAHLQLHHQSGCQVVCVRVRVFACVRGCVRALVRVCVHVRSCVRPSMKKDVEVGIDHDGNVKYVGVIEEKPQLST